MKNVSTATTAADYADSATDGDPEVDLYAYALIVSLSIVGMSANAGAALIIRRKEAMHNSFGILCLSHVLADFITCAITLCWSPQTVLFVPYELDASWLGYVISLFAQFLYCGAMYVYVAKAINRLVAICLPAIYRVHFTTDRTVKVVIGLWAITFCQCTIFLIDGCHIWFDGQYYIWYYEETPCGLWFYVDTVFDYCLLAFILLCDAVTFFGIHRHRRRICRMRRMAFVQTSESESDSTTSMITREKFWCDIRFFAQ
ncbi:CRE-SRX-12 protein, partial [Aphelenchoides avenae]